MMHVSFRQYRAGASVDLLSSSSQEQYATNAIKMSPGNPPITALAVCCADKDENFPSVLLVDVDEIVSVTELVIMLMSLVDIELPRIVDFLLIDTDISNIKCHSIGPIHTYQ